MSQRLNLFHEDVLALRANYVHELTLTVSKFADTIGAHLQFADDFHIEEVIKAFATLSLLKESKLQKVLKGTLKEIAVLIAIPSFDIDMEEINQRVVKVFEDFEDKEAVANKKFAKDFYATEKRKKLAAEKEAREKAILESELDMKEKQIQEQARYETAKKRLAKRDSMLKEQAEKEEKERKEQERLALIQKENEMKERIKQDLAAKLEQLKEIDAAEKKRQEALKIIEEKNKIIEQKNKELQEKQKVFKEDPMDLWNQHFPQMKDYLEQVYNPIMNCSCEKIRKCSGSASAFFKLCGRNVAKQSGGKRTTVLPLETKELKLLFKNNNVDYLSDITIRKALKFVESGDFMNLSDDIEDAFKAVEDANKPSSPKKRSQSLERQSSNLKSPLSPSAKRRSQSLERQSTNQRLSSSSNQSSKGTSASKRNDIRKAKRSSSLSAAPMRSSNSTPLSKKASSNSFSSPTNSSQQGDKGVAPSFRRSGNVITYDLWLAASQASKGLPPPIDGMSAEQNLDMRKMLSTKAQLRAKKNWLIALRTIVTCRHWAGVAGYDWKYDQTPVEKLPGFVPLTPRGSSRTLHRGFSSSSNNSFKSGGGGGSSGTLTPRSKARIGTQF